MNSGPDSRLPFYFAVAYALLVIYASLHPFSGWRDNGVPLLAWLTAGWPRYLTAFDVAVNVLAYIPLGFFLCTALQKATPHWGNALSATLLAALLSFAMEAVQNYLPSRVPSNLDLVNNSLGAALGAVLALGRGRALLSGGRLHDLRGQRIVAGRAGDLGLLLMGLWLLTQLNPEILLFGVGDLRHLLDLEDMAGFDAVRHARLETVIAAANTFAAGLVLSCLVKRNRSGSFLVLLLLACLIRSAAAAVLVAPDQALRWITPGNARGVALGAALFFPALFLASLPRRLLAGVALLFATVLVNLVPENPYLVQAAQVWRQGHFLNFNGLTRLASMLWPFLALPWLLIPEYDPWKNSTT
ncbi:MAG TPA: VanZ family protein [Rhodocyclaceae bacterium]